eukprot:639628-Pelagomonas_calceolata.AAC.1
MSSHFGSLRVPDSESFTPILTLSYRQENAFLFCHSSRHWINDQYGTGQQHGTVSMITIIFVLSL